MSTLTACAHCGCLYLPVGGAAPATAVELMADLVGAAPVRLDQMICPRCRARGHEPGSVGDDCPACTGVGSEGAHA